ncbi:DNA ligase 1-like [Impatiens glandulifera]|uniref:DNA ligase 1-like n=1 Tax=Impatiens glandulifera TaxID=253017 RepID=UPI001FB0C524|nr:DNA ligase 1-like [Impatiens glandulifera]
MVEDIDTFLNFPWGKVSFRATIKGLTKDLNRYMLLYLGKKKVNEEDKDEEDLKEIDGEDLDKVNVFLEDMLNDDNDGLVEKKDNAGLDGHMVEDDLVNDEIVEKKINDIKDEHMVEDDLVNDEHVLEADVLDEKSNNGIVENKIEDIEDGIEKNNDGLMLEADVLNEKSNDEIVENKIENIEEENVKEKVEGKVEKKNNDGIVEKKVEDIEVYGLVEDKNNERFMKEADVLDEKSNDGIVEKKIEDEKVEEKKVVPNKNVQKTKVDKVPNKKVVQNKKLVQKKVDDDLFVEKKEDKVSNKKVVQNKKLKQKVEEEEKDVVELDDAFHIQFKRKRLRSKALLSPYTVPRPKKKVKEDPIIVDPMTKFDLKLKTTMMKELAKRGQCKKLELCVCTIGYSFLNTLMSTRKWINDVEINAALDLLRERAFTYPKTYATDFTILDCHFVPLFAAHYDQFIIDSADPDKPEGHSFDKSFYLYY